MNYVIKKSGLKNYLCNLGFTYTKVVDKTKRQKYIYLFENTIELKKAIGIYTEIKNKLQNK